MEKEKIETLAAEDNKLLGTSDQGEKVKRSVYKVRDKDTGVYDRVHFETDSKMIWDATYNARPDMVARRDSTGSIEFKNILAEGNATINVDAAIKRNLAVTGTTGLTGKLTASGGAEVKNGLSVTSGSAAITNQLTVNGATILNNNVTVNNNKVLTLAGGSDLKLTSGSEVQFEDKTVIKFDKEAGNNAGNSITIGGGARTIVAGGEAGSPVEANTTLTSESLYLAADTSIELLTNLNSGVWADRKRVIIGADGLVTTDGGLYTKQTLKADGATTLGSTLTVAGVSNFNNDINLNNNKQLKLNGGSDIVLTSGSEVLFEGKTMMAFENDTNGHAITIGGGARTVVGSGEAHDAFVKDSGVLKTDESLYLVSDQSAKIITNLQGGWASKKTVDFTPSGGITSDGTINSKTNLVVGTSATVGTTLGVTGAATLGNTLAVTGRASLNGGANISNSLNVVNASATIDLDATIKRNLSVAGTSSLTGVVTAGSNVNLTNGNLNIKGAELRTGGTDNKALVISAADETLYLRASKADSANSGEIKVEKTRVAINKPMAITGSIDASSNVSGANVIAKSGQLSTTKNGLTTTLSSESTTTFDINTGAGTVRINKPTTVSGNIVASGGNITAGGTLNISNFTIERKLVDNATSPGLYTPDASIYIEKPLRMPAGAAVSTNLNADKVDGCDVNDGTTTTTNLWTANKVNTQKADKSINISAGTGLTGGGNLSASRTISHADTSNLASITSTAPTMLQNISVDGMGHVTGATTYNLDNRYPLKSNKISAGTGLVVEAGGTLGNGETKIKHAPAGNTTKTFGLEKVTEVIKSVNIDEFGHISGIVTYDMDKTFATPEFVAGEIANANLTVDSSFIAHSRKNPTTGVMEKTKNTVNFIPMANYEINYSTTGGGCIQFIFS